MEVLAQTLDKLKCRINYSETASGSAGVVAGILMMVSIPLPVVLPVALGVGGLAAVSSLASTGTKRYKEKKAEKTLKEICTSDWKSSKGLIKCLNELHESLKANINNNTERCASKDIETVICAASATSDTVETVAHGVTDVFHASGVKHVVHIAGPVVAGVGIALNLVSMGVTIHDMIKNKSKHPQAKEIEEHIELLEMEMYLRARQIIPVKYLLVKKYLQEALHDIKL